MKKIILCTLTAIIIVPLFLLSCGMGLEPSNSRETSLSFSFAFLPNGKPSDSSSRAIFPGDGSLYIMMAGESGNQDYYGPYTASISDSATITITDIPAGRYTAMKLLYTPATGLSNDFLRDFLAGAAAPLTGEVEDIESMSNIEVLFRSKASLGFYKSPVICKGKKNTFPITMVPVTPYCIKNYEDNTWTINEALYDPNGLTFKGFIAISNLPSLFAEMTQSSRQIMVSIRDFQASMTINKIVAYDDGGHLVKIITNQTVTRNLADSYDFTLPYNGKDHMYLYVDVSGTNPIFNVEPSIDLGGPISAIKGSIHLFENLDNFDTVSSVLFSTTLPTVGSSFATVGFATGSISAMAFHFDGSVLSSKMDSDLYVIITGEKYGISVQYVLPTAITITATNSIEAPDPLTPLTYYVVLVSQTNGQGFKTYLGQTGTLEISTALPPVTIVLTVSAKIETAYLNLQEPNPDYCAIIPITPLTNGTTYTYTFTGSWPLPKSLNMNFNLNTAFTLIGYDMN